MTQKGEDHLFNLNIGMNLQIKTHAKLNNYFCSLSHTSYPKNLYWWHFNKVYNNMSNDFSCLCMFKLHEMYMKFKHMLFLHMALHTL
jgi:hypothetical protein